MNGLVPTLGLRESNGVPVVNSRKIAEVFEKNHNDVLRAIDNLLESLSKQNCADPSGFLLVMDTDPVTKRVLRSFDLTRDAFTLLVMGFNGEKALRFKVAYIQEFNRMEEALRNRLTTPDLNDPQLLRGLLLQNVEKVIALQNEVADLAPKALAFTEMTTKDGEASLQETGKIVLKVHPNGIFPFLHGIGWIYRRHAKGPWLPFQPVIDKGYMMLREVALLDGTSRPQAVTTPKGRAVLQHGLEKIKAEKVKDGGFDSIAAIFHPDVIAVMKKCGFL